MSLTTDPLSELQSSAFQAFVCDSQITECLAPILSERDWSMDQVNSGGIENAIRLLSIEQSPTLLLIDISESEQPLDDLNALAEVCRPGTMVIAVGNTNDVHLYRSLLSAGVQDYLVKPVNTDDLKNAILNAEMALRIPEEIPTEKDVEKQEKVIAVVGVRGGVGASTFVSSCAWITAHELDRHIALLDLDLHFGTNALIFDLEPGRGLCDALENPGRVDGLFIERAMIKESDKLSILGAEASLNEPYAPDPAAISHLLNELRQNFQNVIMDVPKIMASQHPMILSESTDIILVTDLSLAATRDTIRLLSLVKKVAPDAKVFVLANRVGTNAHIEVDPKDFEASVEAEISWSLPFDQKTMVMASKTGKALPQVASASKMVNSLRDITKQILGIEEAKEKKSLLGLFKKSA